MGKSGSIELWKKEDADRGRERPRAEVSLGGPTGSQEAMWLE